MPQRPPDRAIPLLPFRSLARLKRFYAALGFRLEGPGAAPTAYLIATQGPLEVHFWRTRRAPVGLAYVRTRSAQALYRRFRKAGLPEKGAPSLTPIVDQPWGMREFSLTDSEGNLLRFGAFPRRTR